MYRLAGLLFALSITSCGPVSSSTNSSTGTGDVNISDGDDSSEEGDSGHIDLPPIS